MNSDSCIKPLARRGPKTLMTGASLTVSFRVASLSSGWHNRCLVKVWVAQMKSKQVKKRLPKAGRKVRETQAAEPRASVVEKLFYLAAIVDSTGEAILSQNMDGI